MWEVLLHMCHAMLHTWLQTLSCCCWCASISLTRVETEEKTSKIPFLTHIAWYLYFTIMKWIKTRVQVIIQKRVWKGEYLFSHVDTDGIRESHQWVSWVGCEKWQRVRRCKVQFLNTAIRLYALWPVLRPDLTWQKGTRRWRHEVTRNLVRFPAKKAADDIIKCNPDVTSALVTHIFRKE